MSNLLSNPAIQSGIIPFVVALGIAFALKRFGWFWSGLAFAFAYYLSVYLAAGFQFLPLTSTRKILLLGMAAIAIGLIFDATKIKSKLLSAVTFLLGAASVTWVIWPVLARQEGIAILTILVPALVYTGWLTSTLNKARSNTDQGAMMALALGLGTGISAILGASALTGQLGIAIGAIAGAFLLLSLLNQNIKMGSNVMLPAGLLSGLLGVGAVIYASLPWYCLVPLAAIPLTAYTQLPENLTKFKALLLRASFTLPFTIIAIVVAWISTSSSESMY
jgi:hypothetical protein